jgi:hypothetical protein
MDEAKGRAIVRSLLVRYHAMKPLLWLQPPETEVMFFDSQKKERSLVF